MLLLFANLYLAMFTGTWLNYTWTEFALKLIPQLNEVGTFLTSIFGDNVMTNFGDTLVSTSYIESSYPVLISVVLATITSIGIVVMAVKGVKKAFGIFFMGIRR